MPYPKSVSDEIMIALVILVGGPTFIFLGFCLIIFLFGEPPS